MRLACVTTFFIFAFLVGSASGSPATLSAPSINCVQRIVDEIVRPLLVEGRGGDSVGFTSNHKSQTVTIRSPRGSYEIRVSPWTTESDLGQTVAPIRRNAEGKLEGFLQVRPNWLLGE